MTPLHGAPLAGARRARAPRRLVRAAAVGLAFVLVGGACFGERRGLSRDGLLKALEDTASQPALPTVDELVSLRVPEPPPKPQEVDAQQPASPAARARLEAARGDLAKAEAAWSAGGAELWAHRCLVEGVLRRYDKLVDACSRFLDAAPGDARAPAAVRILGKARSGYERAGDIIAERGAGWVDACGNKKGAACADLALLVADGREIVARRQKDAKALEIAAQGSGRVRHADIEGPFHGDMRVLFARDLTGAPVTPHAPFFERFHDDDDDGVFDPSVRSEDGLYRMHFAGKGGGNAHVFVTSGHAVRVRVDGVVVAERFADLPAPSVVTAEVRLSPGTHLVDVSAWSTGRSDHIGVALLRDDGTPALVELPSGAARPARGAGAKLVARAPTVSPSTLAGGDAADVEALTRLLWQEVLARPPSFGADPDVERQIAAVLVSRFGWSPLALAVAAEAVGDDRSVPDRVASSAAARLWSLVRKAWPDHPVARIAEARDLRDERPDEALRAYRALVAAQPRYPFGQRELIDMALDDGLVDEARSSANALLAVDESADNLDAAISAYKAAGDEARAAALEEKRASLDASLTSAREARRLLNAGNTDEGLAALERAAHAERDSPALEEYVGLLALRSPSRALKAVDGALAQFPNDASLVVKKAELLEAAQGKDAARAFLVGALPRVRGSDRAARYAEELGVPPAWQARLALGDRVIAERRALSKEPFPGHPAVALLDDVERVIYEDDSSLKIRHLIIELRTKDVLNRFGEINTGGGRVIRLRVIKPDGTVVERERHRGVDDVSLPQLTPGDIVELLTVERDGPTGIGGSFETRALDGTATPALSRRYVLSFPAGWDKERGLDIVAQNGLAAPAPEPYVDGEGRKRTRYVFAVEGADGAEHEPFSPDASETARTAGFSWGVDLALWSRLRGITLEQAAAPNAWLAECARRIAGGGDDAQKLARIFAFVARRIEPAGSPDDATAVLATGQGQRTPLFVALLRAAGLDASPVALQLATQPDPSTFDLGSYSVVGVRVRQGGREHFAIVDGNAVLDQLPEIARGARVLDLSLAPPRGPDVDKLLTALPDDVLDDAGVLVQVDLAKARKKPTLSGLVVVTIPPSKADGARRGIRRATQDQLKQIFERSFTESLPGIQVTEVKTPGLDLAGTPLRLGAKVTVPLPDTGDVSSRFDHLFSHGASGGLQLTTPLGAYLQVADRKQPVLVSADKEVLEVQLSLPPTSAFVEAPEPLSLKAGPFSLEQKVEIDNGKLYWRREIEQKNARIPVDQWAGVRVALAGLSARSDARLSFVAGEGRRKTDSAASARTDGPDSPTGTGAGRN